MFESKGALLSVINLMHLMKYQTSENMVISKIWCISLATHQSSFKCL